MTLYTRDYAINGFRNRTSPDFRVREPSAEEGLNHHLRSDLLALLNQVEVLNYLFD
jgi:hypothetical protein